MTDLKFSSIGEALHFRMTVSEDHFFVEEYWDAAADCCLKDLKATEDFVANEITDEEMYLFGEVADTILEKKLDRQFYDVYKERVLKVKDEYVKSNCLIDLKHCKDYFPPEEIS